MLPERLSVLQKHFIYEKKSVAAKIKSSTENFTSIIYGKFILEFYFGTFHSTHIVEIKK